MRKFEHRENRKEFRNRSRKGKKFSPKSFLAAVISASMIFASGAYAGEIRLGRDQQTAKSGQTESGEEYLNETFDNSDEESPVQLILGRNDEEKESSADQTDPNADVNEDNAATMMNSDKEKSSSAGMTIPEIVADVMPCMVQITNTSVEKYYDFFGGSQDYEAVSAGSGIIVAKTDDEVLIATNNHVISNTQDLTVTFSDGDNYEAGASVAGVVKGIDSQLDLAIVAVNVSDIPKDTLKAINVIRLGSSDDLKVGEQVVAIGNALGYGQSVSTGIISAKGRKMKDSEGVYHTMLQTDASINPGNSGGALLNMKGELVGINEAKQVDESVEGVGYAIPISDVQDVLTEISNRPTRTKVDEDKAAYLGVSVMSMPGDYCENGYPAGAYVQSTVSGLAADKAGIKEQDIIVKVNDIKISSSADLVNELQYHEAGEEVDLTVLRLKDLDNLDFDEKVITVKLGSKKDAEETPSTDNGKHQRDDDVLGMFGRDDESNDEDGLFDGELNQDTEESKDDSSESEAEDDRVVYNDDEKGHLDIKCMTMPQDYVDHGYPEGVYISEEDEGGAADAAGIKAKDIIVSFDGVNVSTIEQLLDEVSHHKAGETVDVSVMRLTDGDFVQKDFQVTLTDGDGVVPDEESESESSGSLQDHDSLNLFGDHDAAEDETSDQNAFDGFEKEYFGSENDNGDLFDWFSHQGNHFGD